MLQQKITLSKKKNKKRKERLESTEKNRIDDDTNLKKN